MKAPCAVEDCGEQRTWLGYCGKHAWRFKKYGDPLYVTRPHEPQSDCSVDGCTNKARSRSFCHMHLRRAYVHGDVTHNENAHHGTDQITYSGAHLRIRNVRGRAALQRCVRCSGKAHHWAFDHTDPDPQFDPDSGLPYSADPFRYQPMCTSCHKQFDHEVAASAQVIDRD